MSGIAGIASAKKRRLVKRMLDRIAYRGNGERIVLDAGRATLGVVFSGNREAALVGDSLGVQDYAGEGHFARAWMSDGKLVLERDPSGVAPLYYGTTKNGTVCFASEVKALLDIIREVNEMPPGCRLDGRRMESYFHLQEQKPLRDSVENIAAELRARLDLSVVECLGKEPVGAWLSGGLDSSAIVALARLHVKTLHTFSGGLPGAPDLEYARAVASFARTEHHEIVLSFDEMLAALPEVIRHLESFDALLVRSSIVNYLVGRAAADHVATVFSGEGGDELFAGYEYLKALPHHALSDELIDITRRLHNTALQRVDRCAGAHGLTAHVCFLDPRVLDYALRIPVEYKLRDGVEKWILRKAMAGLLPEGVLQRQKAKFWEGSGVGERLSEHAETVISNGEFNRERSLLNSWTIRSKEELMYYRIFKEQFGAMPDLSWMGRTKGLPTSW
jgi:asparagine synthase (glutamine-hydrolysing)